MLLLKWACPSAAERLAVAGLATWAIVATGLERAVSASARAALEG
ncbi:MAG: hypothetical protein AAGK37_20120 [Pseudomonadota bacterium]